MRAGRLKRRISIEAAIVDGDPDAAGAAVETYRPIASPLAEIVSLSTEEFLRSFGEVDATLVVFRTRYLANVTSGQRLGYDGRSFDIKEVKELGFRKGLELRCEERRS